VTATIATLWIAAVAAITTWFVANPVALRGPLDPTGRTETQVITDQRRGYSLHEGFDSTRWVVAVAVINAVAAVALVLNNVWSKADES
jgi:hypothetical protein